MSVSRREFLNSSSLAVAGAAFLRVPLVGQTPQTTPPAAPAAAPKFEDVRRNVGIFTARGGTIGWLVVPDGALAIDSQYADTAPACIDGLKGKSPKGIDMLINTHHHPDHVGGNAAFRPAVKTILQQEGCAKLHQETTQKAGTAAQQAYADVTFGESWSRTLGDEKIWANFYGPGHTGSDSVIFFEKANVAHMGDLMFNRVHARVDGPSGASIKNWIGVLEKVAKRHGDAIFIFGHSKPGAPVTGPAKELLYFRDYLSAVLDYVRKGIKARQTKEQIVAATALPGFTEHANSGQVLTLAGVLGSAYDELTK
jgi:glyoxylase-like metal-dependent hydrolase (beta-lactamase superfamily II)